MNKAIFGKYYDTQSPVHSLDPRTKLIVSFAMIVILFLATNWLAMAFCTVVIIASFMLAHISPLRAIHSILPVLFIAVIAALFNLFFVQGGTTLIDWGWLVISEAGLDSALFLALRLTLLLMLGSLLTMTTTTLDITEGIEKLLSPFERIGLPAHDFAFVMGTALGFVPLLAGEFTSIRKAQLSRGAGLHTSPIRGISTITSLIVPLFASIFRHADKITDAMEARCYHGPVGRTLLHPLAFRTRDLVAAIAIVCVFIAVLLLRMI